VPRAPRVRGGGRGHDVRESGVCVREPAGGAGGVRVPAARWVRVPAARGARVEQQPLCVLHLLVSPPLASPETRVPSQP